MTPRRAGVLFFLGLFGVQLAWIFSLPAFRGIDEHDHVYRADAVAHGEWVASGKQAPESRGDLVSVRLSIVEAARPVCSALPYTDTYDCNPFAPDGDGRVLVGSAAARYHPLFYAIVGTAARPFDGESAVIAMRVTTALMSSLLVAGALVSWRRLSPSSWMPLAFVVVLTPTMTYSTAVAAPNGVEAAGALLAWVSLLRLAHRPPRQAPLPRGVITAAVLGLAIVATLRSMGPGLAVLITVSAVLSGSHPVEWLRDHRRSLIAPALIMCALVCASAAWTVSQGTNDPSQEGTTFPAPKIDAVVKQPVLWFFQSIAAFPLRGEQSLPIVYGVFSVLALGFIGFGIQRAGRRLRWVMGAITLAVVVLPLGLTAVSYEQIGFAWQGRYAWPLSMGVPLLAGLALSGTRPPRALVVVLTSVALAATAVATGASQAWVTVQELDRGWAPDGWVLVPSGVPLALTLGGYLLILLAHAGVGRPTPATPTSAADASGSAINEVSKPSANLPR